METAIRILEKEIKNKSGNEKEEISFAIEVIKEHLLEYDDLYKKKDNIKKALYALKLGKTISNAEGHDFIAYYKVGKKYFQYSGSKRENEIQVDYQRVVDHVENWILETNEHWFF